MAVWNTGLEIVDVDIRMWRIRSRAGADEVETRVACQARAQCLEEGFRARPHADEAGGEVVFGERFELGPFSFVQQLHRLEGDFSLRHRFDVEPDRVVGDGDEDQATRPGHGELAFVVAWFARRIESDLDRSGILVEMRTEDVAEDDTAR